MSELQKSAGFPRGEEYQDGEVFDVIVIGSGPAGMTAALYSGRGMQKTLLIEKMGAGGQAALTDEIENYPGFPEGINGFDLVTRMEQQAKKFGIQTEYGTVSALEKDESTGFFNVTADNTLYRAKSVIVTSGLSPKRLGVAGEEKFIGNGISFCATCDGAFYRDKIAAVVGGGDAAVEEALFLTRFATKVYLIHRRDELRAAKSIQQKILNHPKVEILWSSIVEKVVGDDVINHIVIKNVKDGSTSELKIFGMFLYIGGIANTDFLPDSVKDEKGYIITDENMKTSIPGLFAAGDCRVKNFRQVATAVGDGALASHNAEIYLSEHFG